MIEELDESLFISRFEDFERVGEKKNFSYKGLRALFQYLEDNEDAHYKLDVIALCGEYSEYKDLDEYLKDYSNQHEKGEDETDEEFKERIEEEISDKTTLIKLGDDLNDGFIIGSY